MDAPGHIFKGNPLMHELPLDRLIGPGVVIRVADKARDNINYKLTIDGIPDWETRHWSFPDGAMLMMDSGWTHHLPNPYATFGTSDIGNLFSFCYPTIRGDTARFIAENRSQISIVGVDNPSFDHREGVYTLPAHRALLGAGIIGLELVANLHQIPDAGAIIYAIPIKLQGGSGCPTRVFAVLDDDVFMSMSKSPHTSSSSVSILIGLAFIYLCH